MGRHATHEHLRMSWHRGHYFGEPLIATAEALIRDLSRGGAEHATAVNDARRRWR